jgi:protein tyrosine kinase modulator
MLPSTTLTLEDVLLMLRARVWLLLVTLALVSAATAAGALLLPNRYRSETLILVVSQRVPESYVKATVTARIEDHLQSITQQILSRTRLERIIRDLELYGARRRTDDMESIIDDMRKDIDVKVVKGGAFRVAYVGDNARTVMDVTNRLASLFIEENLRDREVLADDTNRFLGAQVADARRRLIDHEKTLEAYRKRFSGELPSQLTANVQAIQNVHVQLQSLVESINRDRDRRLLLEQQLRGVEREIEMDRSTPAVGAAAAAAASSPTAGSNTSRRLAAARAELATLQERVTSDHPDLRRKERVIRELETRAAAEAHATTLSSGADAPAIPVSPVEAAQRARVSDLRAQLEQLDRQLAFKETEDQRLRGVADGYQRRIDSVPARESELAELTRDYSTLQTLYQTLLAKQEESKIAANLERRQIGDQFKLLDPAQEAERPFSPRRRLISLVGIAGGFAVGLGLVALVEYRDRTLKTEHDVAQELMLPVLAVVPFMESDDERQRAAKRRLVAAFARGGLVAACLPVVVYSLLS